MSAMVSVFFWLFIDTKVIGLATPKERFNLN
jgi:hypothetical protein